MKVIIAGSRDFFDYATLLKAIINSKFRISEIVSGGATGVDALGERYAAEWGIPVKRFPADWIKYGKMAGPKRNQQMAQYAHALIAIRKDMSRGTSDMIERAKANYLRSFVVDV